MNQNGNEWRTTILKLVPPPTAVRQTAFYEYRNFASSQFYSHLASAYFSGILSTLYGLEDVKCGLEIYNAWSQKP